MFFLQCDKDDPIVEMVELVKNLALNYDLIFITGRPEYVRFETETWLKNNGLSWNHLLMRQDNDKTEYTQFKLNCLKSIGVEIEEVAFAIDDEDTMCKIWKNSGITVLQVFEKSKSKSPNKFLNSIFQ